jgi:hypothetical protein
MSISGAELLARHLKAQDVRCVIGVADAKIDRVYDRAERAGNRTE